MNFGYFDDKNKEYVITRPDTPWPWINYLGNHEFFSLISNTAGGYAFYKDARYRRLMRYRYNNIPMDNGGRYFYINDGINIWSPGWKPVKTELDHYECRHGLGYTRISGTKNKLKTDIMIFVPIDANCEIHQITIKNIGDEAKSLSLYSYIEWCLWNAEDDQNNLQRNLSIGDVEIEGSTLFHKTEYKDRRNHFAFYHVNEAINGFDTDREQFVGLYNELSAPQKVLEKKSGYSIAHGWSPIASHRLDMDLKPGESRDMIFVLGYIENDPSDKWETRNILNKTRSGDMISRFDSVEKAVSAFCDLKSYWEKLLDVFTVRSSDEKLDRMVNIWNQYQCMVTFNLSRSASFFEVGIGRGMGFRDSNQDIIGFVHMLPDQARQRILDISATQFDDGSAYHQFQPLTKRGNSSIGGNFNDDPLWLILSTTEYIKETGDFSILDEIVPFDNDPLNQASHFHHMKASFYHVVNNLGPHRLPLIGRADWNDCLNLNCFSNDPDESFQTTENRTGRTAESLMIAGLFVVYGKEFARLCLQIGKDQEAADAQKHIDEMIEAVRMFGWDGEWFLRAYDYFGRKVGSRENEEGKIFIESQGWCSMAQIGLEQGMVKKSLDSVKKYLDCDYGIVLNHPAFTRYYIEYGEISTYPPGYKENAGIFCHNNPWIIIAETMLGRGDQAWDYYKKISPAFLDELVELHKTEPYVYAQMIAGKDAACPGEAKNSWLTGTAAWNYHAVTRYILGIMPDYEGLLIDPCIPKDWTGYQVNRKLRGTLFEIHVSNPEGICKGIKSIKVNGSELPTRYIPYRPGDTLRVDVTMGTIE